MVASAPRNCVITGKPMKPLLDSAAPMAIIPVVAREAPSRTCAPAAHPPRATRDPNA